jgi:hypothetical protein
VSAGSPPFERYPAEPHKSPMLTDVPFTPPTLTDDERARLRAGVEEYAAPLRRDEIPPPAVVHRGVRFYLADALLLVGDALVLAGHALGAAAERLDPHP